MSATTTEPVAIGDPSNDAEASILAEAPWRVAVTITGDRPLLMHRYSCDAVAEQKSAKKGSATKTSDNVESYVWRDEDGLVCLPGDYVRGALTDPRNGAAKYRPDPRSPRKSALDLYRAGVVALTDLAPIVRADGKTTTDWDYLDRRRVTVGKAAVSRERPAFAAGWSATVMFLVVTPHMISESDLRGCLCDGGRLTGVGDFRPTFGRFSVTNWARLD